MNLTAQWDARATNSSRLLCFSYVYGVCVRWFFGNHTHRVCHCLSFSLRRWRSYPRISGATGWCSALLRRCRLSVHVQSVESVLRLSSSPSHPYNSVPFAHSLAHSHIRTLFLFPWVGCACVFLFLALKGVYTWVVFTRFYMNVWSLILSRARGTPTRTPRAATEAPWRSFFPLLPPRSLITVLCRPDAILHSCSYCASRADSRCRDATHLLGMYVHTYVTSYIALLWALSNAHGAQIYLPTMRWIWEWHVADSIYYVMIPFYDQISTKYLYPTLFYYIFFIFILYVYFSTIYITFTFFTLRSCIYFLFA